MTNAKVLSAFVSIALMSATAVYAMGRPRPQDPGTPGTPGASTGNDGGPAFVLGDVLANGNGCARPVVEVSQDQRGIKITPEAYDAQTDAAAGKAMDRKSCNVMINATAVPPGYRLRLAEARFEGSYSLEAGASAQLSEEAFSSGSAGERALRVLGSDSADTVDAIHESLTATATLGCGEAGALRVNTALLVQGSQAINARASEARVDSLVLRLELVDCAQVP